jgi:LmbE family N-acetylglucosaminyl deacetylase
MKILVIAAHPDDEILGMGGTLCKHSENNDEIHVLFVSDGVTGRDYDYDPIKRKKEISDRKNMALIASKKYKASSIHFLDYPNLRLEKESILEITKDIEELVNKYSPEIIYTHHSNDTNIDHRITSQAAIFACRPIPCSSIKIIRLFEIPSSTEYSHSSLGAIFEPNCFSDISDYFESKILMLKDYDYEMREFPHPRSKKAIAARDSYRGSSVGVSYAESFMQIRSIF